MSGARAVVIGLARSGTALARQLHADGYDVLVVDGADTPALRDRAASLPDGITVQLGGYADDVAIGAAMVCPSPGVPWHAPVLDVARRHGVPVRSEIDLVFERCRGHIVGITGTNGKTTTTALVGEILAGAGARVHVGGNIGTPVIDRLGSVRDEDWLVLELSSFQLETVTAPRCDVGCVLNVTPDHLDRHAGMEEYASIKSRAVRSARTGAVLGWDDPITREMAAVASAPVSWFGRLPDDRDGATVDTGSVMLRAHGASTTVLPVRDVPIFGDHNVLNVLAAVAIAHVAGVEPALIARGVRAFRPVAHRLETVLDSGGVLWVNDSKATNAESAAMGLRAFGDRPIVWIGGGTAMGDAAALLAESVVRHARVAVLNGASAMELDAALAARDYGARIVTASLADAVRAAAGQARPGDVVLLSPGSKSFDQFRDFEERGARFTELVRAQAGVDEAVR